MAEHLHITPIGDDGLYILNTAGWRIVRPVLDKEKCIKCGLCLAFCPVNSIEKKKDATFEICYDYCKGCGICANECSKGAIHMAPEGGLK